METKQLCFTINTISFSQAEYVLDIVDYQQDCENGMPKFGMDMSDLDTNLDEEGNPTATGKIVFTEEYNDPISVSAEISASAAGYPFQFDFF